MLTRFDGLNKKATIFYFQFPRLCEVSTICYFISHKMTLFHFEKAPTQRKSGRGKSWGGYKIEETFPFI